MADSFPAMLGRGFHLNAGALFDIAVSACKQMVGIPTEAVTAHHVAFVSIVFSAAALETFINEAGAIAQYLRDPDAGWGMAQTSMGSTAFLHYNGGLGRRGDPPPVITFATLLHEAERSRASTEFKYLLVLNFFDAQANHRGRRPFQDFDLLIELRNLIVHGKRETFDLSEGVSDRDGKRLARVLDQLGSKQAIPDAELIPAGEPFIDVISTQGVARWACNTAAAMVQEVIRILPDGDFKEVLKFAYGPRFRKVAI